MKLKNLLIVGVLSVFAFTSCRNDASEGENEDLELRESDREADLRANEQRLEAERNSVTARIQENQNLSTFSENMNRNQVTQSLRQGQSTVTGQGQTTQEPTSTTTQAQTTTQNQSSGQGQTATGQTANQGQTTTGQAGSQMQGQGSYTIFAPSNSAYEGLSEEERNQMNSNTPENRNRNVASINYLMVEERLTEENLRQQIQSNNGTYNIRTMQGENITATLENDQIILRDGAGNQARITETDSTASDGVVFVIDGVLKPQDPNRNDAASRMNNANNTGTGTGTGTGTDTGTGTTDRTTESATGSTR